MQPRHRRQHQELQLFGWRKNDRQRRLQQLKLLQFVELFKLIEFQQLQLTRFINPSGLEAIGANVYRATEAAGVPINDNPGQQGIGFIKQGFIERSNVDIVNELVSLIVAQRAYEVNSRAIQASDQMLSTATNIVR